MPARIRVLAGRSETKAPVGSFVYACEVFDDADLHGGALWTCSHPHTTPAAAHECGRQWLERVIEAVRPMAEEERRNSEFRSA